jgi:hypothetical protein
LLSGRREEDPDSTLSPLTSVSGASVGTVNDMTLSFVASDNLGTIDAYSAK